MKENPSYTELSTRASLEWGLNSGLWRKSGSWKSCNDAPAMEFGIRELDGSDLSQMIQAVTPSQRRNYVAMEVKKNLIAEERKAVLAQFDAQAYKKVAVVVMGEPPAAYKANVHAKLIADKKKKIAEDVKSKREAADSKKKAEKEKAEKEKA